MAGKIICLCPSPALQRSMTFDSLTLDAVNRAASVRVYASGKGINAARVARTLGESPVSMGFAGGETGRSMLEAMDTEGLEHDFVEVESPSRVCLTLVDHARGHATELVEESKVVAAEECERLIERLAARLTGRWAGAAVVILTGSLPPGVPTDFYARCARLAKGAGAAVILDARGAALSAALAERPEVIKPNESELGETVGQTIGNDDDLRRAIHTAVAGGPAWALVTRGSRGAVLSDGKSFWELPSPRVPVISAIGSGDSVAGGLAVGLARGRGVVEAARLGIACGAANAMTSLCGEVHPEDVERLLGRIEARKWD